MAADIPTVDKLKQLLSYCSTKKWGFSFFIIQHRIRTNVRKRVINVETLKIVVEGQYQAVPVLTPKHLKAISKIHTGVSPRCAPDILRDLVEAGLVEETANDLIV
ncbi:hypothetical protein PMI05_01542 [Brevibacillus sp. BC25]|nr:hypothetical protein PMI05_01542 [Brevibacillus sp. BC25]